MLESRDERLNRLNIELIHDADSIIRAADNGGFSDGVRHERKRLIARLEQFKTDSVVATLLLELLKSEEKDDA